MLTPTLPKRFVATVVALVVGAVAAEGAGLVLDEQFDGPTPSWRVSPSAGVRVLAQLRTRSPDANRPTTAERLVIACPGGYASRVEHEVGSLRVLDELSIEVVVRANRPGLQLAAQVIFPRSFDPATGKPLTALVHGLRYAQPGEWQRLRLAKVPLLAERQARLMNADPRLQVDTREAYIDSIVLVVPGGPRESLLEIDQLQIVGVAGNEAVTAPDNLAASSADVEGPLLQAPGVVRDHQAESFEPVQIRRRGDTLSVAGVPLVPRMIEYRGEPLDMIADLGFNAIWLAEPATEAQLQAAREAKLWVVCPPPEVDRLKSIAPDSIWQTVLAWSMGLDLDAVALDGIASRTEELRRNDPLSRPLMIGANDRAQRFGRLADVLVLPQRQPLDGNSTGTHKSDLEIMGCSRWTQLSLGWSPQATRQAQLLAPKARHLGWHQPHGIRNAAVEAMAAGARGLLIRTPERLSRASPEADRLIDQLQLLNHELALVEPWLVNGKRLPSAELTGTDVTATAWQLGQARLVYVPPQPLVQRTTGGATALGLAGVPETTKAHLFSPAGLLPVRGNRVAGGYRIQLGSLTAGGFVLMTDDSRALAAAQQRVGRAAAHSAQIERGLAVAEVSQFESIRSQLLDANNEAQAARLAQFKRGVQQIDQLLASRDYPRVVQLARQVRHDVGAELYRIEQASRGTGFTSVATQYEPRLLPTHQALEQSLRGLRRGPNLLMGGDFEDLESTISAGWVNASYAEAKVDTALEFQPQLPYHGRACLRLTARATGTAADVDDTQPKPVVWITSPPLTLSAGSVVEVLGWARVATQIGEQRGELVVVDSLGGDQLAIRIPATTGWQPFRMVRTVDDDGQMRLNFALTGPASADIDAVMIREVIRPQQTAVRSEAGVKQ